MPVTAASLRQSGLHRVKPDNETVILRPETLLDLKRILGPQSPYRPPFRPMGANSAATDCNRSSVGTVIDMTAFNRVIKIDTEARQVTVQAGVRLGQLAQTLAEQGMELDGSHDLGGRTVGGAVAGGCVGPAIGDDHGLFAAQVTAMKLITPTGSLLDVNDGQKSLLHVFRLSYGMLGVIYEITLRTRPISGFVATHRRCSIAQFSNAIDKLVRTSAGIRFLILPFSDAVYLDLRRFDVGAGTTSKIPWKIRNWSESTMLPSLFRSLHSTIPLRRVRYRMIDKLSKLTQGIVTNCLVANGSTSISQSCGPNARKSLQYSTWFFPATDFSIVCQAYSDFCQRAHAESGFRCDMPTVGYRLSRDQSAVLSPSYDEPMIALRAVSTQTNGWENFAIDYGDFAKHWGASPVFNQTREVDLSYTKEIFQTRLEYFRRVRRQIDADQRMMNPFLSQFFL